MNQEARIKKQDRGKKGVVEWKKRAEEMEENWKRALADYKNLVRRTSEERNQLMKFANSELILRLLPALDLLQKAARHSGDEGVKMAEEAVRQVLGEEGLEVVEPKKGEMFDEKLHECAETVEPASAGGYGEAKGGEKGKVAETVEVGYKWRGEGVLKPAKVKVYK